MSTFVPYYKWFGIGPDEQPAHHYRLVGVQLYEPDADVIENAADQRMAFLRGYQQGTHAGGEGAMGPPIFACLSKDDARYFTDTTYRIISAEQGQPSLCER